MSSMLLWYNSHQIWHSLRMTPFPEADETVVQQDWIRYIPLSTKEEDEFLDDLLMKPRCRCSTTLRSCGSEFSMYNCCLSCDWLFCCQTTVQLLEVPAQGNKFLQLAPGEYFCLDQSRRLQCIWYFIFVLLPNYSVRLLIKFTANAD